MASMGNCTLSERESKGVKTHVAVFGNFQCSESYGENELLNGANFTIVIGA